MPFIHAPQIPSGTYELRLPLFAELLHDSDDKVK